MSEPVKIRLVPGEFTTNYRAAMLRAREHVASLFRRLESEDES